MLNFTSAKIFSFLSKVWFLWLLSLVLNIITFLLIYFKVHTGQETLALRYNILTGVVWYGKGYNLYFIPGIGLILSLADFILFRALKNNEQLLSLLAPFVSFSAQLILFFGVLFLAKVN